MARETRGRAGHPETVRSHPPGPARGRVPAKRPPSQPIPVMSPPPEAAGAAGGAGPVSPSSLDAAAPVPPADPGGAPGADPTAGRASERAVDGAGDAATGVVILRPAWAENPDAPEGASLPPSEGPELARGRSPRRWWVSLLVGVLGLLAGVQAFLPHRHAWVGHNGDHYYYASTALQYAGVGYEESLRVATAYFHYPYSPTQLDLGYLNPAVAPLIYPRVAVRQERLHPGEQAQHPDEQAHPPTAR